MQNVHQWCTLYTAMNHIKIESDPEIKYALQYAK